MLFVSVKVLPSFLPLNKDRYSPVANCHRQGSSEVQSFRVSLDHGSWFNIHGVVIILTCVMFRYRITGVCEQIQLQMRQSGLLWRNELLNQATTDFIARHSAIFRNVLVDKWRLVASGRQQQDRPTDHPVAASIWNVIYNNQTELRYH